MRSRAGLLHAALLLERARHAIFARGSGRGEPGTGDARGAETRPERQLCVIRRGQKRRRSSMAATSCTDHNADSPTPPFKP